MASDQDLDRLRQGVGDWNASRGADAFDYIPDLTGADLSGLDLSGYNFVNAVLDGADLRSAILTDAYFGWASLREVDLTDANLFSVNCENADLRGANLTQASVDLARFYGGALDAATFDGCRLMGTDVSHATLRGASFEGSTFTATVFNGTDLSGAVGLADCEHESTSSLDTATIALSVPLPAAFLRGCGVPEALVDAIPDLFTTPIEVCSVFLSHASKDGPFVRKLYADLRSRGVRCYYAPHDLRGGSDLRRQLRDAIQVHDRTLLVLSPNSIESAWVEDEIRTAFRREAEEGRRVLFPITLTDYTSLRDWELFDDDGRDLAREVRTLFIPNFSDWANPETYQAAASRLVKDLAEPPEPI